MNTFKIYTPENAISPANTLLATVKDQLGFVPNVFTIAASHGERTRGLVVPRRRRAVVLSES